MVVRVDSRGLPAIIPLNLRKVIIDYSTGIKKDIITIKAILTIISVFRVFSKKAVPDLENITGPFSGLSETFPNLEPAVREVLGKRVLKLNNPELFVSESSSPNGFKSTMRAG